MNNPAWKFPGTLIPRHRPAPKREHDRTLGAGTMSGSGATCPSCGAIATTRDIRIEGRAGRIGERMTAVVVDGQEGKEYRLPTVAEIEAACVTEEELGRLYAGIPFGLPDEPISPERPSPNSRGASGLPRYGFGTWRRVFTNRQLLAIGMFIRTIRRCTGDMAPIPRLGARHCWRVSHRRSVAWPIAVARSPPGPTITNKSATRSPASRFLWSGTSRNPAPWPIRPAVSSRPSSGWPAWSSTPKRPPWRPPRRTWCDARPPRRSRTASTSCAPTRPTTTPSRTPTSWTSSTSGCGARCMGCRRRSTRCSPSRWARNGIATRATASWSISRAGSTAMARSPGRSTRTACSAPSSVVGTPSWMTADWSWCSPTSSRTPGRRWSRR